MTPDWTPLDTELARWRDAGLRLPFWWRDDDAVEPGPALDRLIALAGRFDLPLHLAVIPAGATRALAETVTRNPALIPLVHGWAHASHAPEGQKKAEFGAHRPLAQMRAEAERGLATLTELFGPSLAPVFVPPWNRMVPDLAPDLPALGYTMLSTFGPRPGAQAAPELALVNTHLDPIDWRGSRSLVAPDRLIAQLAGALADRREGRADTAEPYGLLTHHLVHDAAIWSFTEALLSRLLAGPVTLWTAPRLPEAGR